MDSPEALSTFAQQKQNRGRILSNIAQLKSTFSVTDQPIARSENRVGSSLRQQTTAKWPDHNHPPRCSRRGNATKSSAWGGQQQGRDGNTQQGALKSMKGFICVHSLLLCHQLAAKYLPRKQIPVPQLQSCVQNPKKVRASRHRALPTGQHHCKTEDSLHMPGGTAPPASGCKLPFP